MQQYYTILGTTMDRVVQTMDRWERLGVLPAPPPAQPGSPLRAPPSPGPSGLRLSLPQEYKGTAANCQGFLLQLDLVSCLTGKALEWANAVWREGVAALDQFEDHLPEGRAAGECLFHLRQGTRSAQEFALEFWTLAAGRWMERLGPNRPLSL